MKKILVFCLLAIILCSALIVPTLADELFYQAIMLDDADITSPQGETLGRANEGDKLVIIGEHGDICRVILIDKDGEEIQGYCDGDDVAILYKGIVTTRLNVRCEPNTDCDVVGVFEEDSEIFIFGDSEGNWYSVEGADKGGNTIKGYCHKKYIDDVIAQQAEYDGEINIDAPAVENDSKRNALELNDEYITDSLPEKDSIKWYKFTLDQKGDAAIRFNSLEDTVYVNCWQMNVYNEKGDMVSQGVFSARNGRVNFCITGQEAGTYYAEMISGSKISGNPLMNGHDDAEYELSVVTSSFTRDSVPDGTVMSLTENGSVICVLNGTLFIKKGDKEALVAYCNINGKSGPVLISKDKDSVVYLNTTSMNHYESAGSIDYDGETYYYSSIGGFIDGNHQDTATAGLYCCTDKSDIEEAVEYIMDIHYGKDPEAFDWGEWWCPISVGAIVLLVIIIVIINKIRDSSSSSYSSRSYSTSSSNTSSSSTTSSSTTSSSTYSSYSSSSYPSSSWYSSDIDYCKDQIRVPCFEARENLKAMLASNALTYDQKQELVNYHNNYHIDSVQYDPVSGYSNIYDGPYTPTIDTTSCSCSAGCSIDCGCGSE